MNERLDIIAFRHQVIENPETELTILFKTELKNLEQRQDNKEKEKEID